MLTLPSIIDDILERKSKGLHDEIYEILRISRKNLFVDRDMYIGMKTKIVYFDQQSSDALYKALNRLTHRVISEWNNLRVLKENSTLRVESIIYLYNLLRRNHLEKEIAEFVFHQLLLVAFDSLDRHEQGGLEDETIHKLHVDAISLDERMFRAIHYPESFHQFIRYIETKRILGLPEITTQEILNGFDVLLETAANIPHVQSQLDDLFRHFLAQDPEVVEYASTRHHQSRTLEMLIRYTYKKRWYGILAGWKDLLLDESSTHDAVIDLSRIAIEQYSRSYRCLELGLTPASVDVWDLEEALSIVEAQFSFQGVLQQALEAIGYNAEPDAPGEETNAHHPHADALFEHSDRESFPGHSASAVELEPEVKSEEAEPDSIVD